MQKLQFQSEKYNIIFITKNMTTEHRESDSAGQQMIDDLRERELTQRLHLLKLLQDYVPDLPEEHLKAIASQFELVEFDAGDRIVVQGEPGNAMYLLTQGRVQVVFTPFEGAFGAPSEELAILGEGDLLGEMALVFNQPRSATAVALEAVKAFSLTRDSSIRLQAFFPAFWGQVELVAERRLKENQQPT